jgi:predicted kinase
LIEEAQFKVAEFLLSQDYDVVIEWGTWSRSERMEILSKIKSLGHSVYGYFLNPELSVLIKRVHSREADWAVADRVTRNEIIDSAQAYENPQSDEISLYDDIWFRD